MADFKANTIEMRNIANDIRAIAKDYQTLITQLYQSLIDMPTKSREWVGNRANDYVRYALMDKTELMNVGSNIKKLAKIIEEEAGIIEATIREMSGHTGTKLKYPSEGLKGVAKQDLVNSTHDLSAAKKYCSFNIPEGFKYKNYLLNLSNKIERYKNRNAGIRDKIGNLDQCVKDMKIDLKSKSKSLNTTCINKRSRLVK